MNASSLLKKLSSYEIMQQLYALEQKDCSNAEHMVYDALLEELGVRLDDDAFIAFAEELEALAVRMAA